MTITEGESIGNRLHLGVGSSPARMSIEAFMVFACRGLGAAVMLLVQVLIARRLGVNATGRIGTAITLAAVLAVVGRRGSDLLIIRRVATQPEPSAVREEYRSAVWLGLPPLGLLGMVVLISAPMLASTVLGDKQSAIPMAWLAMALPAFGLTAIQGEAIKGLGRPVLGAAVQSIVGPMVTLTVFLIPIATTLHVASAAIAAGYLAAGAAGQVAWTVLTPAEKSSRRPNVRAFAAEARPFYGTSVFSLFLQFGPVLLLAVLAAPTDVGRYFATDRWTQIPSMVLVAINATVGPRIARAWSTNDRDGARALLRRATWGSAAIAAIVGATLIGFAPQLLRIFGTEYVEAAPALRILGGAQFVVLACGPVSTALAMSGGERQQRRGVGIGAILSLFLCTLLIPAFSLTGAAIGAASGLAASRLYILVAARRVLGHRDHSDYEVN